MGHKIFWGTYASYCAEANALFARMDAVSEMPNSTRKGIINTAIVADKTSIGFTTKYDAMWLLAAHGQSSAKLNIIKNAHNITEVDTPAFTIDRGFTGNSSSDALNCNYNLSTDAILYTRNLSSFGIYNRTADNAEESEDISAENPASNGLLLIERWSTDDIYVALNNLVDHTTSVLSSGMWIVSRIAHDNYAIYRNGVAFTSSNSESIALVNAILHLLCANVAGVLSRFSSHNLALAFVGGSMSQAEITAFQTIWVNGYLNSIGAKI